MKKRLMLLITLLCVSGLCACTQNSNATQPYESEQRDTQAVEADKESDVADSTEQNSEKGDTSETENTQEQEESDEVNVVTIEPDTKMEYKGKEIFMSLENEDESGGGNIVIKYGDVKYELSEYAEWITAGYLVEIDEAKFYVILQACYSNDWVVSYIEKYDGNTFADIASQNGAIADVSSITKNQIVFDTRTDLFGTYGVKIPMKFENDKLIFEDKFIKFANEPDPNIKENFGDFEADSYYYKFYNEDGYRILILKQNLKAKSEDSDIEIKAGEQIIPYGYNEEEKKFYFTYEDNLCYFTYENGEDGYSLTIDGIDQYDMFEDLPYAG